MLVDGMRHKGHDVDIWSPLSFFTRIARSGFLGKWLGYIDQYIIFPVIVMIKIRSRQKKTLYVFTDQALGPWVPMVKNKPHVIHCHDFLAYRSAKGEIPQKKVGWTGREYQKYIFNGFKNSEFFISVSEKTRSDLHRILNRNPSLSFVVYNGFNKVLRSGCEIEARKSISLVTGRHFKNGYILHVGGNQFYKNRVGLIEIYNSWRSITSDPLPLLLIGERPDPRILNAAKSSPFYKDLFFLSGMDDEFVIKAYHGAALLLFPSLEEGFGWPIAEAMAAGCIVVTTDREPMTEVAGGCSFLIPRMPVCLNERKEWLRVCAGVVERVVRLTQEEKEKYIRNGLANASRFDSNLAIDAMEKIYMQVQNYPG